MRWEARRCEQGSEQALFLSRFDELVRLQTLFAKMLSQD